MSRPVPAPQPDLSSRLLAAVAERDHALASRLGQQWVHRKGLAALDRFLLTVLAPSQGLEAAQWLRGQLGLIETTAAEAALVAAAPAAQAFEPLVIQPHTLEEVPIDQQELAALETELAASPELVELDDLAPQEERAASRPAALFGRMKALLRQCLEDAIVGVDEQDEPEGFEPIGAVPAATQSEPIPTIQPVAETAVVEAEPAASSQAVTTDVPVEPARRLSLVPPLQASSSPAPAPASLASLRAWLPDAEEDGRDLPRAC